MKRCSLLCISACDEEKEREREKEDSSEHIKYTKDFRKSDKEKENIYACIK